MTVPTIAPILAAVCFLAYVLASLRGAPARGWQAPALLSLAFLGFSALAVAREGPTGFWDVHTAALWGNQVWFDLLIAVAIGWTLILPRARAQGMALLPWLLAICATGSIAFLAMLARLLYLESRTARA